MALLHEVKVFTLMVLFIPRGDCKGIGTISTTLPPPTTTARPYPGVKLDFGIGGTGTVGGLEVEENAYPWMVFLYNFVRKIVGVEVMDLDLPKTCKPNMTTTTTTAVLITGGQGARQSAEIYHPERDSACVLPDIPDRRQGHTQDGSLLCGDFRRSSCRRWNPDTGPGTW